jgi:hypothetical protein
MSVSQILHGGATSNNRNQGAMADNRKIPSATGIAGNFAATAERAVAQHAVVPGESRSGATAIASLINPIEPER